jgi:tetratricopeptide (TPR) repeat protein
MRILTLLIFIGILSTTSVTVYSQVGQEYFLKGNSYADEGYFKKALEQYNIAIDLNPDFFVAYLERGSTKTEILDYKGAIDDYSKALIIYEANKKEILNKKSSDYAFINSKSKYVKFGKNEILEAVYLMRAVTFSTLDEDKSAIEDYNRLIELNPKSEFYYSERAIVKSYLGDSIGANEDFDISVSLNKKNYASYHLRGNFLNESHKYEAAIKDYSICIKNSYELEDSYFYRGVSKYGLNDYNGAIEDFSKLIKINPKYK